jgi:hypothetical protein
MLAHISKDFTKIFCPAMYCTVWNLLSISVLNVHKNYIDVQIKKFEYLCTFEKLYNLKGV